VIDLTRWRVIIPVNPMKGTRVQPPERGSYSKS
jgi:hypothetical protein